MENGRRASKILELLRLADFLSDITLPVASDIVRACHWRLCVCVSTEYRGALSQVEIVNSRTKKEKKKDRSE